MIDLSLLERREREAWDNYQFELEMAEAWADEAHARSAGHDLPGAAEARQRRDEATMRAAEARRIWRQRQRDIDAGVTE